MDELQRERIGKCIKSRLVLGLGIKFRKMHEVSVNVLSKVKLTPERWFVKNTKQYV